MTELSKDVFRKGRIVREFLENLAEELDLPNAEVRGRGLIQGLDCGVPGMATLVCRRAFDHGLILETSGPESNVIKVLPSLVIDEANLRAGLEIIASSLSEVLDRQAGVEKDSAEEGLGEVVA